jgi:hypothetical protein
MGTKALGFAALIALAALGTVARAAPVIIDFEDLSTGGPGEASQVAVFQQYASKGVVFNDPKALDYSKGPAPWSYQGFAHSGTKAIEPCYGKEFCDTPVVMTFTTAQKRVKVWVGYSHNLGSPRTAVLAAFNSAGAKISQATATLQPASSAAPVPIRTSLEVSTGTQNIAKATVSFAADAQGRAANTGLAVDDVELDTAGLPPPCGSTRDPVVTLASPKPGQVVRFNSFNLNGTVDTTAPLQSATLTVRGSSGVHSYDLLSNGVVPHGGGTFSAPNLTDLLFLGANTVTVKAQDCRGSGERSTTVTYQPCDGTTSPSVGTLTITDTGTSRHDLVTSDTFKLTGRIDSPVPLQSAKVTVTAGFPHPGSHQLTLIPNLVSGAGPFDVTLGCENLYQGENTVTVTALTTEGCSGEKSVRVVYDKRVLMRISGTSYIEFAYGDPKDTYRAADGFLHVSHDPGCGIMGNNGDDVFFTVRHDLPFWATLEKVEFQQFWPKERKPDAGGGSYLTRLETVKLPVNRRDPPRTGPLAKVHWENSCNGPYNNRTNEYVISFIVSVPAELVKASVSIGEPMFDPKQMSISSIQPPKGYGLTPPPPLPPPPATKTYPMHMYYPQGGIWSGKVYLMGTVPNIPGGNLLKVRNSNTVKGREIDLWFPIAPGTTDDAYDPKKGYMLKSGDTVTPDKLGLLNPMPLGQSFKLAAVPLYPNGAPSSSPAYWSADLELTYQSP